MLSTEDPRGHVVNGELLGREQVSAVLAAVGVTGIEIAPIQLDLLPRQTVVSKETNDLGDRDVQP